MQIAHGNLSVGDNGSLTCTSIIPVDVMEWLDSAGQTIVSEANINISELSLTFTPVNTSINNKMYTCRANKSKSVNKTVIVSVSGKMNDYTANKFALNLSCGAVENPLMIEINGPDKIPSIGESVTLTCKAAVLLGVIETPVLTLKHPNGTNLSSDFEISFVLDPVYIADAGEYVCTGKIELENVTTVHVETNRNLSLKCKPSTTYMNFPHPWTCVCIHDCTFFLHSAHPTNWYYTQ